MVDRVRLLKIALSILGVATVAAWGLSELGPRAPVERAAWLLGQEGLGAAEAHLVDHLEDHPGDEEAWRALVRQRGQSLRVLEEAAAQQGTGEAVGADELARLLQELERSREPHLEEQAFERFLDKAEEPPPAVLRALYGYFRTGGLDEAVSALERLSEPRALVEAARLALLDGASERALALIDRALEADALDDEKETEARRLALTALERAGRADELDRRLDDDAYASAAEPRHRLDRALAEGDPVGILVASTEQRLSRLDGPVHLAALAGGACWLVFLLFLGGARSWTRREQLTAALALPLGVLSGVLTLAAATWLNHSLGHTSREPTEVYLLAYFVLGVGFKEEAIKLLCFAPLVPLLVRCRHELVVVIVASVVGLGFAVEENTGYFTGMGGDVGLGRFLTANFLHLALTGFAGYYLVQAVRRGGEAWTDFTVEFFKVVGIHGLYDYLLSTSLMAGMSFFAMMAFVIISQIYLRLVLRLPRPGGARPGKLLGVFVVCLSVAFGVHLAAMAARFGLLPAAGIMAGGALGNVLIAYMFFRELEG